MRASDIKTTEERIEEATCEAGVLLIALSPLDAALGESHDKIPFLMLFIGLGTTLFTLALFSERNRAGDPPSRRLLIFAAFGLSLMWAAGSRLLP